MDRARAADARRGHRRRPVLTRTTLGLATAGFLACSSLGGDPDRIVAIEVVGPRAPTVQVGDTVRLSARALNARGATVPDAPVVWHVLDTGQVGLTLDTASGLVTGVAPGSWRVQARVEELATPAITVTVTAPAASAPRAARDHRRTA